VQELLIDRRYAGDRPVAACQRDLDAVDGGRGAGSGPVASSVNMVAIGTVR